MKKAYFRVSMLAVFAVMGSAANAQTIAPSFAGNYSISDLGNVSDVPALYGGIVFKAGDPSHLLIGGGANGSGGAIYEVGLIRDANNHVTGFSGPATLYATAPFIDGGLAYGPGGVLFATGYPNNTLLEFLPGSTSPDKTIDLNGLGVASSVGTLGFVPAGFPGAGSFQIGSYNGGQFYTGTLTPDGLGTYDLTGVAFESFPGRGPEGIAYVPLGSTGFAGPSMLMAEYGTGTIGTYLLNADGSPNVPSRQDFILGLGGAEGSAIDPLTGDFFFSTFGGGNRLIEVQGFATPSSVPEPSSLALLALGGIGLAVGAYRRSLAKSAN